MKNEEKGKKIKHKHGFIEITAADGKHVAQLHCVKCNKISNCGKEAKRKNGCFGRKTG